MLDPMILNNFRRYKAAIDTRPFLAEIEQNEPVWMAFTRRQTDIPAQRETNTILLRIADEAGHPAAPVIDIHESCPTVQAPKFPRLMDFLEGFARQRGAELCRASIVRLKPDGSVYAHIDEGEYYRIRDRFHLVLDSPSGSYLASGDENIVMQQGELWWFNNKLTHHALNKSRDHWRVHCIFDLLSRSGADVVRADV